MHSVPSLCRLTIKNEYGLINQVHLVFTRDVVCESNKTANQRSMHVAARLP